MPLTLCIPHLVEIGGPLAKMWREGQGRGVRGRNANVGIILTASVLCIHR
jgi:hypothetical protein